jgi:VWFA-related protein
MRRSIEKSYLRFLCCFSLLGSLLVAQNPANSSNQASDPTDSSGIVFRSSSRVVLIDVVVTDHKGDPVKGLKASDFTLQEDGKQQKLSAFAAHLPSPVSDHLPAKVTLPAHQYSNFTAVQQESDRSITVVMFDTLNTTGQDQTYARKQMIQFLRDLPPGRPVALFVLSAKLRMIQGFTGSSDALIAAGEALLRSGSLLLSPEAQTQQEEITATNLEDNAADSDPRNSQSGVQGTMPMAPIGQSIRNAIASQDSLQKLERMRLTLQALNAMARALSGYPGRKNLIWLSAEFPVAFGPGFSPYNLSSSPPNRDQQSAANHQARDLSSDVPSMEQTAALLAASQIAVYPIDVRGQMSLGTGIDASTQTVALSTLELQSETANSSARQVAGIWDSHEAMADIARETGGEAFYGTNDLKAAMSRSLERGSDYYTLAYVPENRDWTGKYRKVEVKTPAGGMKLTYRRGYYAVPESTFSGDRAALMMTSAMQLTVPEYTELLLKVQVLPPDESHPAVRVDFAVDARDLIFQDAADQRKHASLDFAITAWDKTQKLVQHSYDTMEATLRPEAFRQVMQSGVPFHQELELKPGTYTLRLGVLDRRNQKIGTLDVPLTIPK